MRRKTLSFILSICLVLSLFPGVSYGTEGTSTAPGSGAFSDIQDHWAREAIQKAVTDGYVKGYPDGKFLPERPVSRAEFVSMVNNALQLRSENKVKLVFSDVKDSDWFSAEVAKAGYVRYIKGTSATTFSPDQVITRQEAALMLSRFLPKEGMKEKAALEVFPDRDNISDWAEEGMAVTVNKGYMNGHANGTLAPLGTLTRAEAVTLIGQILAKETIVREDVFVKESGDILRDKIYVGDITIDEEVGEGDATLQNLSALSVVYVNGGGSHTVTMENSLIIRLVVTKEGTQVRVLAGDGTSIYTSILFNNNLLVDENGDDARPDGETFEDIVVVQGTVTQEQAQNIAAAISGQIQSGGQITQQQVAQAVLSVLPNGNTNTNQSGTIVVEVPSTPSGNTGGGGRRPSSDSVTVTGEPDYITATVAAITTPADAVYTYQWSRSDAESGVYTEIETATGAAFTIAEEDIGCFLKVTATGMGAKEGTVLSRVIGPIGFDGGAGTEASPFEIANWYHLDNMRYQLDKSFILTESLGREIPMDLSVSISVPMDQTVLESAGYNEVVRDKAYGWEPVGQFYEMGPTALGSDFSASGADPAELYFTGTFDGNGKIIRDLYIDRSGLRPEAMDVEYRDSTGLFGVLFQAEVKDLTLQDAYVSGTDYTGALAGYSQESTVSGIVNEYAVSYRSVEASGRVSGVVGDNYVGGIAGINDAGVIEDSFNKAEVRGTRFIGGIAGSNYVKNMIAARTTDPEPMFSSYINGSGNEGSILGYEYVGGIAGGNGFYYEVSDGVYERGVNTPTYIHQCINNGEVESNSWLYSGSAYSMKFGGVAGDSTGTISQSVNSGPVTGEIMEAGGIVGATNWIVENCYNEGPVLAGDAYGGIVGRAREATIRFNYNIGDIESIVPPDALFTRLARDICGEDEGEWSEFYEPSSFSANIYLTSMDVAGFSTLKSARISGVYGAAAEEMRNPLTFRDREVSIKETSLAEWNFDTVWATNLQENQGYPFLRWQHGADFLNPITLEVTMPTPATITYGQTLAEAILQNGSVSIDGVSIAGAFSYWPTAHNPETEEPFPDSMEAWVLFEPTDTSYLSFVGRVNVTINRLPTVLVTLPTASAITIGSTLSNSTLSGGLVTYEGTPVPGAFYFDNGSFVPDSLGTYTAEVTFWPDQDWIYDTVSTQVDVEVIPIPGPLSVEATGEPDDR